MIKKWNLVSILSLLAIMVFLSSSVALAQGPIINVTVDSAGISWQAQGSNDGVRLVVNGPDGFKVDEVYGGNSGSFAASGGPDGAYEYELTTIPHIDDNVREAMQSVAQEDRDALAQQLRDAGKLTDPVMQSGEFYIRGGAIVNADGDDPGADKDQLILDDLIVTGSQCVGLDCVNGESFGFDTIRLKENNLRIHFQDTSTYAGFPSNDWRITVNDSSSGGANKFSIDDIDSGKTPFTIEAGTRANALYVDDSGRVGLGTSTPGEDLHIWYGDTPTIRLAQSGGGWDPQTWDLSGNEANFFIRDVTNGSKLPFRIQPNTPGDTLTLKSNGYVGIGTWTPDKFIDIEGAGPGFRLTDVGGTVGDGYWEVEVNNNQNRLNFQYNGGNIPLKIDEGADNNLMQLGIQANDRVDITGKLYINNVDNSAPDYVFSPEYQMLTLEELEAYITANKHLPNVPAGAELDANGIDVQAFNYILLEKIEELTLYTLQQEQTIKELEARLQALESAE